MKDKFFKGFEYILFGFLLMAVLFCFSAIVIIVVVAPIYHAIYGDWRGMIALGAGIAGLGVFWLAGFLATKYSGNPNE